MKMIIYCVTNKINRKQYVGQTVQQFKRRWYQHITHGKALFSAIKKYGRENFTQEIIDTAKTIDELNKKEKYWIKKLNTLSPNGYNLTTGGEGFTVSEETKKKLSESHKGYKATEIQKKRMSESQKIAQLNPKVVEQKRKRMLGNKLTLGVEPWNKGKKGVMPTPWNKGMVGYNSGENNPSWGKHHSLETKKLISKHNWLKGHPERHPMAIKVVVNGKKYPTKKQAYQELGWSFWKFNKYYNQGLI